MKTYSLCGRCSEKKAFKETKICGVMTSDFFFLKILLAEPKDKLTILSSISF